MTRREIVGFLEATPPRSIPPALTAVLDDGTARTYYRTALIFLVLGGCLMWFAFPRHSLELLRLWTQPTETAWGKTTRASELMSLRIDDREVARVRYQFAVLTKQTFRGVGYETGVFREARERIKIEYLLSDPNINRPANGDLDPGGWMGWLTMVVPLIGVWIGVIAWRGESRKRRILQDGQLAAGHIHDLQLTGGEVKGEKQYRIDLVFDANGQSRKTSMMILEAHVDRVREMMKEHRTVGLLYLRDNPQHCIVLDYLLDFSDDESPQEDSSSLDTESFEYDTK